MAITLSVTGMARGHCVHAVTKALQAVAGVKKVSVGLGAGRGKAEGKAVARALIRAVNEQAQVADRQ